MARSSPPDVTCRSCSSRLSTSGLGLILDERLLPVQVDDEQRIGAAGEHVVDAPPDVVQHAASVLQDAASDVRGNGLAQPAKAPGVPRITPPRAGARRASDDGPARRADRQRVGVRARELGMRRRELLDVDRQAVVGERHVDRAHAQPVPAQAEAVLDGVRVPGELRRLGQPFAVEDAARHDEEHLVDGVHVDGSVGALADQDDAIPHATDEPSSALHAKRPREPDAVIGVQRRRRALERRERVQHDVLVHEHEMIVTCARRADVESGACGRERAVAVVDQDVVEIVDLGAMALDRAVETLLAHLRVVEHADDRDWTSRRHADGSLRDG